MKDLIEKILSYIPNYLFDLGRVLASPSNFFKDKDFYSQGQFVNALVFFAISKTVATIANIGLLHTKFEDIFETTVTSAVQEFAFTILQCFCAFAGLWLVRAKPKFAVVFLVTMYVNPAISLVWVFLAYFFAGMLKLYDRGFYQKIVSSKGNFVSIANGIGPDDLRTVTVVYSVLAVAYIVQTLWYFKVWRVYAGIFAMGRFSSVISFWASLLLAVLVSLIYTVVIYATVD
jgi:hypothetical protein